MLSLTETLERTGSGRFIYESETPENPSSSFEYEGETRHVYTNVLPLTVSLTAENATSIFLVGNPFMSRIDIAAFMAGNDGVKSVRIYDGNTVATINSDLQATVAGLTKIEPLQAFFVEFDSEAAARDIEFTDDMLTGETVTTLSESPALRIVADNGLDKASMLLTYGAGGESEALIDAEVKPSLGVYAVSGNIVYDILPVSGAETPLALCAAASDTLTLRFEAENGFDTSSYVLRDNNTGAVYSLDEEIALEAGESSVGRYSLVDLALAVEEKTEGEVFVTAKDNRAVVKSTREEIVRVAIYGIDGRMDSAVHMLPTLETEVDLQRDLQIVSVTLANGSVHNFKIVAY